MHDDTNELPTGGHARGGEAASDAVMPKDMKVRINEQRLLVEWKDGERSDHSLDELRRQCPCASCRTEREQLSRNPLRILKADPTGVRVTSARLVGNYAIQFEWSDGHNTGIFDFRFLRSLGTTRDQNRDSHGAVRRGDTDRTAR